jgi:hypothetical protein
VFIAFLIYQSSPVVPKDSLILSVERWEMLYSGDKRVDVRSRKNGDNVSMARTSLAEKPGVLLPENTPFSSEVGADMLDIFSPTNDEFLLDMSQPTQPSQSYLHIKSS